MASDSSFSFGLRFSANECKRKRPDWFTCYFNRLANMFGQFSASFLLSNRQFADCAFDEQNGLFFSSHIFNFSGFKFHSRRAWAPGAVRLIAARPAAGAAHGAFGFGFALHDAPLLSDASSSPANNALRVSHSRWMSNARATHRRSLAAVSG